MPNLPRFFPTVVGIPTLLEKLQAPTGESFQVLDWNATSPTRGGADLEDQPE
jgi:hypothetical protein